MLQYDPITPAFGAQVLGLDAGQIDDPGVRAELKAAFKKYRMLLFRELDITAEQQARLAEAFGKHAPRPPIPDQMNPEEANTQYVSNTRADGIFPAGELLFHQDHLFDAEPLRAIMLYALQAPSVGGQTKFRSLDETYRRLDDKTRAKAEAVRCQHLWEWARPPLAGPNKEKRQYYSLENVSADSPTARMTWHPLVYREPEGGAPTVWPSYSGTGAFEGIDFEGGQQLLSDILDVAETTETYAHQWRVGDALIWDNFHIQHARADFPPTEKRNLRRSTIV